MRFFFFSVTFFFFGEVFFFFSSYMLTNATEDFVLQFGDEVGGRYSNQ